MHCLKLRHALLAGDRSSSAAIASTIGYSNHPVSNVLDQRTFYLSLLRSVIATIPPGRSPPSRKAVSHPRTISGNFTPNSASQSVLRSIHVTQHQGSFTPNSAAQTLAARQCRTRHSYAWKPMPKRTFTRAAGVSPPWVSKPRLQLQCNEFRISRSHRMHPTGGLRPPLLCCSSNVCRRKSDFCDAHTRIRSAAAGVSPPWVSKLRMQLQCDEFPGFAFASNAPHGGLTPPALVLQCARLPAKN
jgi:hypothetical protein